MENQKSQNHVGMVAVVGRASVGKSSLMNAFLGEKVSIVSPVPQTTRSAIRGILTDERGQLVFVDTPGVHKAMSNLGKVMNRLARASVEGCDVVLLVLDATQTAREEDLGWITRLLREEIPVFAILNKIDDLTGEPPADWPAVWKKVAAEKGIAKEPEWFRVSAMTGEGMPELTDALFAKMPAGELLFPEEMLSDYPRKLAVADIIREKLFGVLREELPHSVAVWIETIVEKEDGSWDVDAKIYVMKDSQKGIVLGEKGRLLRKVKRQAEAELAAIYEHPVRLDLWVKAEKKWTENFWLLKKFGYVA